MPSMKRLRAVIALAALCMAMGIGFCFVRRTQPCVLDTLRACPPASLGEALLLYPNAGSYSSIGLHLDAGTDFYGYTVVCSGSDPFFETYHFGLALPDARQTRVTLYVDETAQLLDRQLKRYFCKSCREELHALLDGQPVPNAALYDPAAGRLYPVADGLELALDSQGCRLRVTPADGGFVIEVFR